MTGSARRRRRSPNSRSRSRSPRNASRPMSSRPAARWHGLPQPHQCELGPLERPHQRAALELRLELHTVALKDLPAAPAQPGTVLLQAGLNRIVVAEILAAEA